MREATRHTWHFTARRPDPPLGRLQPPSEHQILSWLACSLAELCGASFLFPLPLCTAHTKRRSVHAPFTGGAVCRPDPDLSSVDHPSLPNSCALHASDGRPLDQACTVRTCALTAHVWIRAGRHASLSWDALCPSFPSRSIVIALAVRVAVSSGAADDALARWPQILRAYPVPVAASAPGIPPAPATALFGVVHSGTPGAFAVILATHFASGAVFLFYTSFYQMPAPGASSRPPGGASARSVSAFDPCSTDGASFQPPLRKS